MRIPKSGNHRTSALVRAGRSNSRSKNCVEFKKAGNAFSLRFEGPVAYLAALTLTVVGIAYMAHLIF